MSLSDDYDQHTGLPVDKSYLECGLPDFLEESIEGMKSAQRKLASGEKYYLWDWDYANLQSDINYCEIEELISPEQAQYLRKKYLHF